MAGNKKNKIEYRPAGYSALIKLYGLDVIPNWHNSYISSGGTRRINTRGNETEEVFPSKYWPGDLPCNHLEFAIKYDGISLAILSAIFEKINIMEITDYVRSRNTGKYARRLWFLFEFLAGKKLPLKDLEQGNYINLLEPEKYYTVSPNIQVRRQRINNNLLGNNNFCPTIRRTDAICRFEESDLHNLCKKVLSGYTPEMIKRASGYLYNKETRSSFEIEKVNPSSTKVERFVSLLQLAGSQDFCKKERLFEVQNIIVDERFKNTGYRQNQNYIGQTISINRERIYYVCPKPEDLHDLMDGLIKSHELMSKSDLPVVIHAAAISYGFVFLHPFEDGNGRIHRFLIHNILAIKGFSPSGVIFPVSAVMLKNPADYDASLEAFSKPLMPLVEYSIDDNGHMTVYNETAKWYRFIDFTTQSEMLFSFIEKTINEELTNELDFLVNYDNTKNAIQEIVDMPDRLVDLFIRFCLQNNGRLSQKKFESHFNFLMKQEVSLLERAVRLNFKNPDQAIQEQA